MNKSLLLIILFLPKILISFASNDEMLNSLKGILPDNPVILEAGGNLGEDTLRMKSIYPNSTIHVFEPIPSSFSSLEFTTNHLNNVNRYQCALADYVGVTDFYIDIPNNAASSILYPVEWNESEFDKTPIKVNCTTINKWAKDNNVTHVDFMWLDMEGYELFALKYATDILKTVKAIFTEISYQPIRKGSCSYIDLKEFLESYGFKETWKSSYGPFGDALFMK